MGGRGGLRRLNLAQLQVDTMREKSQWRAGGCRWPSGHMVRSSRNNNDQYCETKGPPIFVCMCVRRRASMRYPSSSPGFYLFPCSLFCFRLSGHLIFGMYFEKKVSEGFSTSLMNNPD